MPERRTGGCLCGRIRFTVTGPLAPPVACHCLQCRKGSGHFTASTWTARANLAVTGTPRWFATGPTARRGFCPECGAPLFWESTRQEGLSIEMGAFDGPTGLALAAHMFTDEKGDYYALADGLPAHARDLPGDG